MSGRRDALDPSRLRFVEANGARTRVYEGGSGETVVLVHGGAYGSLYSLDAWSLNLPALSERFHVVAWDKLGQGHTAAPARVEDYTFEALVAHALGVLETLAVGPAHLVGHSLGGLLATRITLERPELVRTLTIVDSNATAPDDPRYPWTTFYVELAKRTPEGPPTGATVRLEPDAQSTSTAHVTEDWIERRLEIASLPQNRAAAEGVAAAREAVWMPSILAVRERTVAEIDERGVGVPTLVVWGADDPSAPLPLGLELFRRLAATTPEVELHVLSHCGHYCFRERPQAFERVLAAFLAG